MTTRTRHKFEPEQVQEIMTKTNSKTPEEALEKWASFTYGLRWNGSYTLGRVGKTFVDIIEVD